jgi:pyruvate kinase
MQIKKTKIVCTIGPASWDYATLKELAMAGMDVARLNMSHGNFEEKTEQIKLIRRISDELNKPIGIMADLQGPKIRLGEIEDEREIRNNEVVRLSMFAMNEELPMQFDLSPFVHKNHRIFLNDGLVQLKITSINGKVITTRALNSGVVSSHKGVNIPDTNLKGASFTEKDREDAEFALAAGVEFINLSFVQSASDIKKLRDMIKKANSKTQILVKIEKKEAIDNLEEIILAVDGVMVARGDLAVETSPSDVPIYQQIMIKLCRQYQKPVIVATQMLESMIHNPRPTRAETSDVANAVMDQVDAIMLSAESASGLYPVEAVATMSSIIQSVESNLDYKRYIKIDWQHIGPAEISLSAITSSAASIAYRTGAKAIIAGTATGRTARILSSFRPDSKIIAIVHDKLTFNQLALVWGVSPVIVNPTADFNKFLENIHVTLAPQFKHGDIGVIVTGKSAGVSGTTNTIKIDSF